MKPSLGWTLLSREALRKAEDRLFGDAQGIRDEIGFLTLHQVYADRFFPGTSVLHTRLRYALFIPWMYEDVARQRGTGSFGARVQRRELWLTGRLKAASEEGVIGGRVYPKPAVQSACMSYWSALGGWGILRTSRDGLSPARSAVHRRLGTAHVANRHHDDDKEIMQEEHAIFVSLPKRPKAWEREDERLDFKLRPEEGVFFRHRWIALKRADNAPALLAQLALQRIDPSGASSAWSSPLFQAADSADRAALDRSRRVSSLAAIGRAVYAAQVETLRADEDKVATPDEWRTKWKQVAEEHWPVARDLDLATLNLDFPPSFALTAIMPILEETYAWMQRGGRNVLDLLDLYSRAELDRKGSRARLPRIKSGRERRAAWQASDTPAGALHYRWPWVRRLLSDLNEALR